MVKKSKKLEIEEIKEVSMEYIQSVSDVPDADLEAKKLKDGIKNEIAFIN